MSGPERDTVAGERMEERIRRTPPVVRDVIPRWLVVLSWLEVAVAVAVALSVRPFGARHVVVLTLILGTLAASLIFECRAARRAMLANGGGTSPVPVRIAPKDDGGGRG